MSNRWLLCSDLDRTLIPNGAQPESPNARYYFNQLIQQEEISLAYVTGRDKKLVNKAITYYNLPAPDYVIADVGATIYKLTGASSDKPKGEVQWQFLQEWADFYKQDWKGNINKDIERLFSDIPQLRKQEISKQKTYKLSYYVPLYINHSDLLHTIQQRLSETDIRAELIWSVDEPSGIGLLDVMPEHATKRHAIAFLMQKNNFDYSNTFFAGVRGNDLDTLLSPVKSILVANAHTNVKSIVAERISTQKNDKSLYIARGGFRNMNGNYSAGVLEGLFYYIPESEHWSRVFKDV